MTPEIDNFLASMDNEAAESNAKMRNIHFKRSNLLRETGYKLEEKGNIEMSEASFIAADHEFKKYLNCCKRMGE